MNLEAADQCIREWGKLWDLDERDGRLLEAGDLVTRRPNTATPGAQETRNPGGRGPEVAAELERRLTKLSPLPISRHRPHRCTVSKCGKVFGMRPAQVPEPPAALDLVHRPLDLRKPSWHPLLPRNGRYKLTKFIEAREEIRTAHTLRKVHL